MQCLYTNYETMIRIIKIILPIFLAFRIIDGNQKDRKKNRTSSTESRSQSTRCAPREATLRVPDGPIPELCHEMDSLGPAVSKLQGKTERRLPPVPVPTSPLALSSLPSPSGFCEGPERPTSIQHFGPRYDTPSA